MQAYQCNMNGIFIGMTNCQPSPLQPGMFLVPGGATTIAPPSFNSATQAAQFNFANQTWSIIPLPPAGLSYGSQELSLTVGTAMSPLAPSISGGAVASYSVSPALPAGLSLDPVAGTISGAPTTASTTLCVIQASNSSGSCSATLSIIVGS